MHSIPRGAGWTSGPLLLSIALLAHPAAATAGESRFGFGVLAGLNNTGLSGDPIPETRLERQRRFLVGGRLDYRLTAATRLGLEPSFVRRGGRVVHIVDERDEIEENTEITLDYLEFPLLLRVSGSGATRPYAVGGLGAAFLLDASGRPPGGGTVDLTAGVHPADALAYFGGGVDAEIGGGAVFFELRYSQGLTTANHGDSLSSGAGPNSFKNVAVQIVAGWRFRP